MNKLCSNYDEKLLEQAQRKKWVKGIILEPTYFMHLYKDIQPNSRHLSSSGLILEGASEDDYVLWKNNGYKLELRVPQINEVLHIKTSTLDAADYNGGCCHTVSESLFLRGATNLNIVALCSGFVLTTSGSWVHHSWCLDEQKRILETRTDIDKQSSSGFTSASGFIAYACVAECRSREDLFKWRVQTFDCGDHKTRLALRKVINMFGIDQRMPHYQNICSINSKIPVTFRNPTEWEDIFKKGGGRAYLSKKNVFAAAGGSNHRDTTFDDWKDTICMITRGGPLPESNRHHIGYVIPSNDFKDANKMNLRMGDDIHPIPSQHEIDNIRPMDQVKVNVEPGLRFWVFILQIGTNGFRGVCCFSGPVEYQQIHGLRHGSIIEFCHEHVMDINWGLRAPSEVFVGCLKSYVKDIGTTYEDCNGNMQTWEMNKDVVPQFVDRSLPKPAKTDPTAAAAWQAPLAEDLVLGIISLLEFWNEAFLEAPSKPSTVFQKKYDKFLARKPSINFKNYKFLTREEWLMEMTLLKGFQHGGITEQEFQRGVACIQSRLDVRQAEAKLAEAKEIKKPKNENSSSVIRVRLINLKNVALNGLCGTKTAYDSVKQRYKIVLDDKTVKQKGYVNVKTENIEIIDEKEKEKEKVDLEFDVNSETLKNVTPCIKQRKLAIQFAAGCSAAAMRHDIQSMATLAQQSIDADETYFAGYVMRGRLKCHAQKDAEAMVDFDLAHECAKHENMLEEADNDPWNLGKFRLQCHRVVRMKDQGRDVSHTRCNGACCQQVDRFEDVFMRNVMNDPVKRQHWESLDESEREKTKEKMKNLMNTMGVTK